MTTQLLIDRLRAELPPIFPRKTASRMIGGYLAAGTLANLDCRGEGPGGVLVGKSRLYERETFLDWFERRIEKDAAKAPRKRNMGA